MASGNHTISDNTNCPICLEEYDLNLHIPRIFPCFDTVCQSCIKELLKQRHNQLTCPQCRAVHRTWGKGFQAFKQNKYIVANLQNGDAKSKIKRHESDNNPSFVNCETHKRKLTLFCRQESCKRAICSKCLTQNHKLHDVEDIEDQHEIYTESVRKTIENITEKRNHLRKAKDEMTKEFDAALGDIENTRIEIIKIINDKLNKFKYDCVSMHANNEQNLQRKIDFLNEKLTTLEDIQRESNKLYREVYDFDLIDTLQASVDEDLNPTIVNVEYKQYDKPEVWKQMASDICGSFISEKRKLNISFMCGRFTF